MKQFHEQGEDNERKENIFVEVPEEVVKSEYIIREKWKKGIKIRKTSECVWNLGNSSSISLRMLQESAQFMEDSMK